MRPTIKRFIPLLAACLAVAGAALLLALTAGAPARAGGQLALKTDPAALLTITPAPTRHLYFPFVVQIGYPGLTLDDAWTSDAQAVRQQAFPHKAPVQYHASGTNLFGIPVEVKLRWTLNNPCGGTVVYTDTLTASPGAWSHTLSAQAPDCTGLFDPTVQITYTHYTASLPARFVVNSPSEVLVQNNQGFDNCRFPTVSQMQTWWNKSPYDVYNLYIGGSVFACRDTPLDAVWVHQVARQGWNFILTWVGPQAPCSAFKIKMSADANTAYTQGRGEADLAADAAARLGFFGGAVIYYDVEAYVNSSTPTSCITAVNAFMRGWAERLHERSLKAGGYSTACTSHMTDWASNDPVPDDVWIAYWLLPAQYRADATVWVPKCVPDSLWSSHQRIRQYAGGHNETYGGVTLNIDSNVLDGEVTSLLGTSVPAASNSSPVPVAISGPQVQAAGLLSATQGWALADGRLFWTEDGGAGWRDISPADFGSYRVLGVSFRLPGEGWMVVQPLTSQQPAGLQLLRTRDGTTWEAELFPRVTPEEADSIAAAYFDLRGGGSAALVLKLQSGSSFSLGRLFVTANGGQSWEERTTPLGEPVKFLDDLHGWTAGGPTGEALYRTDDGGFTWTPESADTLRRAASLAVSPLGELATGNGSPALLPQGLLAVGNIPENTVALNVLDAQHFWALVQESACVGVKQAALPGQEPFRCQMTSRLLATDDGGSTWREILNTRKK